MDTRIAQNDAGPVNTQASTRPESEGWRLDYLFGLARHNWLIHIGVVTLVGIAWRHGAPDPRASSAWLAVMLVLSIGMLALAWSHGAGPASRARRLGYLHTLLTSLIGVTWGLGALFISEHDFGMLLVYSLALGGTALGAVSSQHALPRSCLASLWTSLPLLTLAHWNHDPAWWYGGINAAMVLLYAVVLTIQSRRMGLFMTQKVELSASLDTKVDELTRAMDELNQARREAIAANRAKSRFLAQASHDLRQPIHAIGLLTAVLQDTPLNREQRELAGTIEGSITSVSALFQSLLDISRLDVGGIQPRPQATDLGALLHAVGRQAESQLRNRSVPTRHGPPARIRIASCSAWVFTDAGLLTAIVDNLLTNSVKYGHGHILVGVRHRPGGLAIQVCDQGPGIEAEHLDMIFDEFVRLENKAAHPVEGLGLGLSIVRRLAKLLDLQIHVRSDPGRGTSFVVSGLQHCRPQPLQPAPASALQAHPLNGLPIALIEDDPTVRAATANLMKRWGCRVHALDAAPSRRLGVRLIVSDYHLGAAGNGLDAITRIRGLEGWDVPALVIAGRIDADMQTRLDAAAIEYLPKPVTATALRAWLMQQLRRAA